MRSKLDYIDNELKEISVKGYDAVHLSNIIVALTEARQEAVALDALAAEKKAEREKAEKAKADGEKAKK